MVGNQGADRLRHLRPMASMSVIAAVAAWADFVENGPMDERDTTELLAALAEWADSQGGAYTTLPNAVELAERQNNAEQRLLAIYRRVSRNAVDNLAAENGTQKGTHDSEPDTGK